MQLALRCEYPNGASHIIAVGQPGRSRHVFWGPQITRASNVTMESDGPWKMERHPVGVTVCYEGNDPDHWQIGHDFADVGKHWMYSYEKYKAFWDEVWPGILEEA
jgi:hypothetical protein